MATNPRRETLASLGRERDDHRAEVARLRAAILAQNTVIQTLLDAARHRSAVTHHLLDAVRGQGKADELMFAAVRDLQAAISQTYVPDHIAAELTR